VIAVFAAAPAIAWRYGPLPALAAGGGTRMPIGATS